MTIDAKTEPEAEWAPAERTSRSGDRFHEAGPTWEAFRALEERLEKRASLRDAWTIFIFMCSAIAVVSSVVAIGFGLRAIDESKGRGRSSTSASPATAAAPAAVAAPSSAASPPAAAPAVTPGSPVPVTLTDFKVGLPSATFSPGKYTFQISNAGQVQHELLAFRPDLSPTALPVDGDGALLEDAPGVNKVSDGDNLDVGAAQTRSIDLSQPGAYVFVCNLPGHFKAGMYAVVTVK